MTFFVVRYGWKYPWALRRSARPASSSSSTSPSLAANVVKVLDGGWFPLVIGALMFTLMMTWKQGRKLMSAAPARRCRSTCTASSSRSSSARRRGCRARRCSSSVDQGLTPNALLHNLKHNKVLHERNLFVTVKHHEVPWIGRPSAAEIEPLGNDCWQVTLNFGFKNEPDVPAALERLREHGCSVDDMDTSYFLSRDIVIPTLGGGMADWREKLFAGMHRNAAAAADFLRLPTNRVVELGSKVRSDRHEAALRRRPARDLQDLQGHDVRDDAGGGGARARALRVRAEGPGLAARRPRRRARSRDRAGGAEQRCLVRRDRGAGVDGARRRRRRADAQGPAVRQRVLLRDPPA